MKYHLFLILTTLMAIATGANADVVINETNFPDASFRSFLLAQDYGKDGVISDDEIAGIKKIYDPQRNYKTLKGIEYFTALTSLTCSCCELTELDVSKNTALTELYCELNNLISLDVSKNTALKVLVCWQNPLKTLNVSKNTALERLDCGFTQISYLDLTKNTALTELECTNNQLTSLDLSKNKALISLRCEGNQLTALDVSKNSELFSLRCFWNKIKGKNMDALIASLPMNSTDVYFRFVAVADDEKEENICTKSQVEAAKARGWETRYYFDDGTAPYEGENLLGDLNGDGEVNSADVQRLYALMASSSVGGGGYDPEADLNGDGLLNSADVQRLYAIMAGRK